MSSVYSPVKPRGRHTAKPQHAPKLRRATILGTGVCVPERVIDNEYFSRELGMDTTPEWIESRIGIVSRHWAVDETSTNLAVGAARAALMHSRLTAEDID